MLFFFEVFVPNSENPDEGRLFRGFFEPVSGVQRQSNNAHESNSSQPNNTTNISNEQDSIQMSAGNDIGGEASAERESYINMNGSNSQHSNSDEHSYNEALRDAFRQFLGILVNNNVSDDVIRDIVNGRYGYNGPPKPPSMDEEARKNLPKFLYTAKNKDNLYNVNEEMCSVCLCPFEGEETTFLPCSHHFHPECIDPWMKEHNTCPKCRYQMQVTDADLELERVKKMEDLYGKVRFRIMELSVEVEKEYVRILKLMGEKVSDTSQVSLSSIVLRLENMLATLDSFEVDDTTRHLRKLLVDRVLKSLHLVNLMQEELFRDSTRESESNSLNQKLDMTSKSLEPSFSHEQTHFEKSGPQFHLNLPCSPISNGASDKNSSDRDSFMDESFEECSSFLDNNSCEELEGLENHNIIEDESAIDENFSFDDIGHQGITTPREVSQNRIQTNIPGNVGENENQKKEFEVKPNLNEDAMEDIDHPSRMH